MTPRNLWLILRQTLSAWSDHDAPRVGAALAFYTILSLAPLILLVIAVVALVFGHSNAQDQIIGQVQGMIGQEGGDAIRTVTQHAQKPGSGALATVIGTISLLFGASGVFGELRSALNKMWDVKEKTGGGVGRMLRERFFSFGMVLAIGFLLLVSLVLSAGLAAIGKFLGGMLPVPELILRLLNFVVSLGGVSVLFALIFKFVPETVVAWKDVWVGAIATAFLFAVGKLLIGLYLGKAAVGSAYGAAGSLIVVIVWIYYSSLLFFFGAEFTHVLSHPAPKST